MRRRNFILSTFLASPIIVWGMNLKKMSNPSKGFTVKAGEARFGIHTPFRGVNPNDMKISSKDTDGSVSVFEYIGTQKVGPNLHIHFEQDEIFYIAEGEYIFQVGNERSTLKAGDTIFLPRQVPHTWLQLSDKGKLIYLLQPAGKMEDFFLKMSSLTKPPTPEESYQIHLEHGMKVVGPPLTF